MKQYLDLLKKVLYEGDMRPDRTGTGIYGIFGEKLEFDLLKGFPLLTSKKMFIKGIIHELLWFLSGSTNINDLPESVRHWWRPWADSKGDLGPIYGQQYRNQGGKFDQLTWLVNEIKTNPTSRRLVINLWNGVDMQEANLPCCHGSVVQFYVDNDQVLHCQTYQRSCDIFLGLPVNIASYALLTMMIAQVTGYKVGKLHYVIGDLHLYYNHVPEANNQLARYGDLYKLPEMKLNPLITDITKFTIDDFILVNYQSHPAIPAPLAV